MSDSYSVMDELAKPFKGFFRAGETPSSTLSYKSLEARRKIAEALLGKRSPYPKNIGEGLTFLGESIADRRRLDELDAGETAQAAKEDRIRGTAPADEYIPPAAPARPPAAAPTVAVSALSPPAETAAAPLQPPPPEVSEPAPSTLQRAPQIGGGPVPLPYGLGPPPARLGPQSSLDPRDAIARAALARQGAVQPDPTVAGASPGFAPSTITADDDPRIAMAQAEPQAGPFANPMIPTDIKPAPDLLPSQQPIPLPKPQEMAHPGLPPAPPPQLGPSNAMRHWSQYINNPNVSPELRAHAAEQYRRGDEFRKETQTRQFEEFKDKRERWQKQIDEYDKFQRGAHDRNIDQLIKLQGVEKTNADLEEAYYKRGLPRAQAAEQARLDILKAQRTLTEPDRVSAGGTHLERQRDEQGRPVGEYKVPKGLPPLEEKPLTEAQVKAKSFVDRVKPDLDELELGLNHGKILSTSPFSAVGSSVPGVGNLLMMPEYREANRRAENFAAAFMTHVSGAAYGEVEAKRNLASMIPATGDTQQDIEEKSRRRRQYTNSLSETLPGSAEAKEVLRKANADYDAYQNGKLPPIRGLTLQEAKRLPPGRRFVDPEGNVRHVPGPGG